MITVEEAKRLLFAEAAKAETVDILISDALEFILAQDILSPVDLPLFNQSSMDGYAIAPESKDQRQFEVVGEIKAGDNVSIKLKAGQAVRIFTGASVPASADCV